MISTRHEQIDPKSWERMASDRAAWKTCGAHRSRPAGRDTEGRVEREVRSKKTESASNDPRLKLWHLYVPLLQPVLPLKS